MVCVFFMSCVFVLVSCVFVFECLREIVILCVLLLLLFCHVIMQCIDECGVCVMCCIVVGWHCSQSAYIFV